MPEVNHLEPSPLDKLHIQRMGHAQFALFLDLLKLDIPAVDSVLARWNITLLPFRRVGIEYAPGSKQILERELAAEKRALKGKPKPNKKAKR